MAATSTTMQRTEPACEPAYSGSQGANLLANQLSNRLRRTGASEPACANQPANRLYEPRGFDPVAILRRLSSDVMVCNGRLRLRISRASAGTG
ncbi:MAG: hypothetical protein AAGJ69_11655 [Cyanobacteria bacterium J06559_1]